MAYSWSGALGPRVVPRAAHDVNSCLSRVCWCSLGSGWPGWGGSHACFAPYCAGDVVLETGCKFGRPVSASAAVISDHNSGFSRRCAGLGISVGTRRRPADKQHVAAPGMWTRCCGDDTQSRSLACVYAHLTTGEPRSAASAASWGRSRAQLVLSRVPGPPTGVTRLGSPASPRMVPVDAAACRAYRDPGTRNHSQVHSCSCVCTHVTMRAARSCPSGGL